MSILRIASSCMIVVTVLDTPSAYGTFNGVSTEEKRPWEAEVGPSTYLLLWGNRFGVPINDLLSAKAVDGVIIDHASGLHMGVADGRADELEAALTQILSQRVGFRAGGAGILDSEGRRV